MKFSNHQASLPFNNILIIRTDRIGDVVLTTPAIKSARQKFPNAKITLLVTPQTEPLVRQNPYVDEVLVDDRRGVNCGIGGFWRLVGMLRSRAFDLAVNYHTKKRTNAACFLAGISTRIGYADKNWGFLLNRPVKDGRACGEKHEAQYCLDLLRAIGINSDDLELHVSVDKTAEQWFQNMCHARGVSDPSQMAVIHPGASDSSKMWPAAYFARVADHLIREQGKIVVVIGAAHLKKEAEIITRVDPAHVINLVGQTSIEQMISVLNHAGLLISNDSGPVHVAAALQTPVISIFTRNQPGINPERWRPLGLRHHVVSVPPDESISFLKSGAATEDYLKKITPERVIKLL